MKITHYRDPEGKFARRRTAKKLKRITLFILVAVIVIVLGVKSNWTSTEPVELKSELTVEQETQLLKQYELAKKETALKNRKAQLDAEYKEKSAIIEAELEAIRAEKVF